MGMNLNLWKTKGWSQISWREGSLGHVDGGYTSRNWRNDQELAAPMETLNMNLVFLCKKMKKCDKPMGLGEGWEAARKWCSKCEVVVQFLDTKGIT